MKKIIAITIITMLAAFSLAGCFNGDNEGAEYLAGAQFMGEISEINGNVITVLELEMPGNVGGGRFVMGGGNDGERVVVSNDDDDGLDYEPEYDEYADEESEYASRGRMAGADAETDMIRVAGNGGEIQIGELNFTGIIRTVTVPRGVEVTIGQGEETADISTLEVRDVIFVTYDADGRLDVIRLMPFQIGG